MTTSIGASAPAGGTATLLFRRWVRATWAGWVLAIPAIAALAFVGEAVGIGGSQALVGAGLGTGVGLMQARVVRLVGAPARLWFLSCVAGQTAAFFAVDVTGVEAWQPTWALVLPVAAGGTLAGVVQGRLLRNRAGDGCRWVTASALGWCLAAAAAGLADLTGRGGGLRGIPGLVAYLGLITMGGLLLGLVTGPTLARRAARLGR